ncbi:MAG TPA: cytochrome c peroxidase [Polyangiaceae bacterium]|nr:cytochrome c peroxidase [Polyangiaceae bacterium]
MLSASAIREALFVALLGGVTSASLSGCGTRHGVSDGAAGGPSVAPAAVSVSPDGLSLAAQLGKQLFFEKALSASGAMSCATCHDPQHAYGPSNGLAVQIGGPSMDQQGTRAVPSLRYKEYTPPFADLLDNPDGVSAPGPGGGFTWDGRVATLAEQALVPLLSPVEMANANAAAVIERVLASPSAALFRRVFTADPKRDPEAALSAVGNALQAFQLEDPSFHPYSSKYDLYVGNKLGGDLSPAEVRGMKLFSATDKGNCTSCHFPGAGPNGSSAMFTDYSYEAIGVPRNAALPVNADHGYFDLGICGPARSDHAPQPGVPNAFCAMFKTPTLRNITTRSAFFHNGVLHSLEQVLRFYNTRDTRPELWYPTVGGKPKPVNDAGFPSYGLIVTQYVAGKVAKFDDLPLAFVRNVDKQMPLDGRKPGSTPPLSEQNIADLLCFLNTLTDDYQPPVSPETSGPCVN